MTGPYPNLRIPSVYRGGIFRHMSVKDVGEYDDGVNFLVVMDLPT